MKKIFLFLSVTALALSLNGCSDDDSSAAAGSTITFKFNGVQKTFTNVEVNQEVVDGLEYITINATDGPTNAIAFETDPGLTGGNALFALTFLLEGDPFLPHSGFVSYITQNNPGHIEGSFSGPVYHTVSGETYTVTEGTFEINY